MIYDVIIIGSGPAGLAAGIYAQRARLSAVVLEREYVSGGQVVNTYEVDNYPGLPGFGGFELGMKLREHAEGLGTRFINIEAKGIGLEDNGRIKVVYTDKEEYRARTLILAMGAKKRRLGVPGEKELAGMGVSYCATCDGAFFKGKKVAVVGGGDVAVEDALFLARSCEKVYVIHRRDELRAAASLQERLKKCENVEFVWNSEVTGIVGETQVEGLKLRRKNQKAADPSPETDNGGSEADREADGEQEMQPEAGREADGEQEMQPEADHEADGVREMQPEAEVCAAEVFHKGAKDVEEPEAAETGGTLAVDGVFIAVGTIPDTGIITKLLHLNEGGYIVAGEDGITEIPGIFAAGDIRTKQLRQIVTAAADGANAVNSVLNYLNAL